MDHKTLYQRGDRAVVIACEELVNWTTNEITAVKFEG